MTDIAELIHRRRHQILIHSCLYYRLNTSLISDYTFDKWARELAELQESNPEIAKQGVYAEYFKDFNGESGFSLPTHLPEVIDRAERLLRSDRFARENGLHLK